MSIARAGGRYAASGGVAAIAAAVAADRHRAARPIKLLPLLLLLLLLLVMLMLLRSGASRDNFKVGTLARFQPLAELFVSSGECKTCDVRRLVLDACACSEAAAFSSKIRTSHTTHNRVHYTSPHKSTAVIIQITEQALNVHVEGQLEMCVGQQQQQQH